MNSPPRDRSAQDGSLMIAVLVFIMVAAGVAAALMAHIGRDNFFTYRRVASTRAFNAAEAGLQRSLFMARTTANWTNLPNPLIASESLGSNLRYAVGANRVGAELILTSTGTVQWAGNPLQRVVRITARRKPPAALNYLMFGNDIGFHNHMAQNYGLSVSNNVWSNGDIDMHRGLAMAGSFTAVGKVVMENKPLSVSTTLYGNAVIRDGSPTSPFYAPSYGEALPEAKPFPVYDFERAKQKAMAEGTYFVNATAFKTYLASRTVSISADGKDNDSDGTFDEAGEREPSAFAVPTATNPSNTVSLRSSGGTPGIVSRTEASGFFFVDSALVLDGAPDTLLILSNATVVCKGSLQLQRPVRWSSPSNEVLWAVNGKASVTGGGGPAHLRGVIYSTGQTHIHQSDPYDAVYFKGVEIADYIHNCEWFRQEYEFFPYIQGLADGAGVTTSLETYGWHEVADGGP